MRIRRSTILAAFIASKILLDCLSPMRGVNFALVVGMAIVLCLLAGRTMVARIKESEFIGVTVFAGACVWWGYRNANPLDVMRYLGLIPVYLGTIGICRSMGRAEVARTAKLAVWALLGGVGANIAVSFVVASPLNRIFYNFEHANLLGSYVLVGLGFLYLLRFMDEEAISQRIGLIGAALASTSSGAFVLSLLSAVSFRRFTLMSLSGYAVVIVAAMVSMMFAVRSLDYELFLKFFGPVDLILSGGLEQVRALAANRSPIQWLGPEYSSSFIWRIYAFFIYWDALTYRGNIDILFGGGFRSFEAVYGGMPPHNDYVLFLFDYGVIALAILVGFVVRSARAAWRHGVVMLPAVVILTIRLAIENNISSFYLLSFLVAALAFVTEGFRRVHGQGDESP